MLTYNIKKIDLYKIRRQKSIYSMIGIDYTDTKNAILNINSTFRVVSKDKNVF